MNQGPAELEAHTLDFPLDPLPLHFPALWDEGPISQRSKMSLRGWNQAVGGQTSEPRFYIP